MVKGSNLSKKSIKTDSATVPIIDFIKKLLPILKMDKINNGTLINNIMLPIGMFNK